MKYENSIVSLQPALKELQLKWAIQNLDIEIQISQGARSTETPVEREIVSYSINSSNRRKFFMHVLRSTYLDNAITASQLVQELGCAKRTLETIIRECDEANWIEICKCDKGHRHIKAMPVLIKTYENYTLWLFQAVEQTGLRRLGYAVSELQRQVDEQD